MENLEAYYAEQFALHTDQSFFLTGKAGTGKTTLLRNILEKTEKNTIVVAPTGVAAINAGGVTIHSMFGLPLTAFIPSNDFTDLNIANNRRSLKKHMRFRKEKRKLLQELDLLIIDEISMVRADILDAVDFILQDIRRSRAPFGGLQVIFIGDLFQLSPVVREESQEILRQYYASPYFFDSYAWRNAPTFTIELQKVYRQQDEDFIHLLNKVRVGECQEKDIQILNKRFVEKNQLPEEDYITLTTHNYQADNINQKALAELPGPLHSFQAKLEGTFNENAYPADFTIQLKVGSQVMFIRNDAEDQMYYNGKLAKIVGINGNQIQVYFLDSKKTYTLKEEVWENINYALDKETNEVKQEKLGSFTQFPIRLAWAITIHKSQGLTFENAVIDIGKSFAPGQAYVALSRCTSLAGIFLRSMVKTQNILIDPKIISFYKEENKQNDYSKALLFAKELYAQRQLIDLFSFVKLIDDIEEWKTIIQEKDLPDKAECLLIQKSVLQQYRILDDVGYKFQHQLKKIFKQFNTKKDIDFLRERSEKAIIFFADILFDKMIKVLHQHIVEFSVKSRTKVYLRHCQELNNLLWQKLSNLYKAKYLKEPLYQGKNIHVKEELPPIKTPTTMKKGATYEITLEMYNNGDSVADIAKTRGMAISTIEQHLTRWIAKGRLSIYNVMSEEKVNRILKYLEKQEMVNLSQLKESIPFEASYAELRHVLAFSEQQKKQK